MELTKCQVITVSVHAREGPLIIPFNVHSLSPFTLGTTEALIQGATAGNGGAGVQTQAVSFQILNTRHLVKRRLEASFVWRNSGWGVIQLSDAEL